MRADPQREKYAAWLPVTLIQVPSVPGLKSIR